MRSVGPTRLTSHDSIIVVLFPKIGVYKLWKPSPTSTTFISKYRCFLVYNTQNY
jgi:hypothetical protein